MNDQSSTENEQQQEQAPAIADQAAFLSTLGINPDNVAPNSIRIEFMQNGTAVVSFTAVLGVTPQALGMAFMASGGMLGGGAGAQSQPAQESDTEEGNVTPLTKTGRRTAAKKTAAKKTAAKKTTTKKTDTD